MAEEYSKYKLYRKYKTEDGVNYTPLDEYQALADGSTNNCDCGYRLTEYRVSNPLEYVCGYVLNENETPTLPEYIVLSQNTSRSISMQTFRINATDPETEEGYYFITFSTSPNYDGSYASITKYSICPDEGVIYDNGIRKYITAQTEISDNVYSYTFSVPVYFAGGEENAPYSQVTGYTTTTVPSLYDDTTKYEKWYEWEYCPDDEQYDKKTGNFEWRFNTSNACDCGYREYEWRVSDPVEYICGSELNGNSTFEITSTSGDWTREGNTFTSNDINDSETTVQRIYFNTNTGGIKFTIDQSSESGYDYLIIGNLDKTVINSTSTDSNYYNHQGKTTGTTSMTINDTNEHFIELMYKKDKSVSNNRDNVIVTIDGNFTYDNTTKYEKWYEWEYCPSDEQYDKKIGNFEWRVNTSNACDCGYREYEWRFSGEEYICGSDVDGLEPYYKYEVWREYAYCPTDVVIEYEPTGNIEYRNSTLIGQNWVMTTQSKLGSELGEEYEQDKRYVLYESYSLCNGELIETEWRESNLVFKTEIEEKYIKYEASETYIPMGSTVGDIIAVIPTSQYCCESTAAGCQQYCYNLFTIYQIDKEGNMENIHSGRMNNRNITLTDNENYSYSLTFGDYCNNGTKAYFTYTLKDEDYHYYICEVKYQKYDYEDDTKWIEISYKPLYPSDKELTE